MLLTEVMRMRRNALKQLSDWKNSSGRKPLVIRGARQVGKTWLMKEFGRSEFKDVLYVNFDSDRDAARLFDGRRGRSAVSEWRTPATRRVVLSPCVS